MRRMKVLLSSQQMAQFVSSGFLEFPSLVPPGLNNLALETMGREASGNFLGPTFNPVFAEESFVAQLLCLPSVQGALISLVGPGFGIDHYALHRRPAMEEREGQPLHADRLVDPRDRAFDVQLMYYPHAVTEEMGGTLVIPGSHLRLTNEAETARYQNLIGQKQLTVPAGTVVLLHHQLWHCGLRNRSSVDRYMFKLRLYPNVPQVRLWGTTAKGDEEAVREALVTRHAWCEGPAARLEIYNRIRLWRVMTGDESFDVDRWFTRVNNVPSDAA